MTSNRRRVITAALAGLAVAAAVYAALPSRKPPPLRDPSVRPPWPIAFPRVANAGGPVVAHPKVAVITFKDDDLEPAIAEFNEKLRTADYFETTGREYGVGRIEAIAHLRLDEHPAARVQDADLRVWLASRLDGSPPFGAPDPNTLYAIYYPTGTQVLYGGRRSCSGFDGYHGEIDVRGVSVGFAVLPRCPAAPRPTQLDKLTTTASHEYFEWASDPFPITKEAWHKGPPESVAWSIAYFPEIADMCDEKVAVVRPDDLGFTVQRIWSNEASLAGRDPCQPGGVTPFVAAIPKLPDSVSLPFTGSATYAVPEHGEAPAKRVKRGATTPVPVFIYGEKPSSVPLRLSARSRSPFLQITASRDEVIVGEEISVSVTAASDFSDPAVVTLELANDASARWAFLVAPSAEDQ